MTSTPGPPGSRRATESGDGPAVGARGITVRPMTGEDAEAVLRIYQEGLDGGDASFETAAPSWDHFDATKLPGHRFVAVSAPTRAAPASVAPAGVVLAVPVGAAIVGAEVVAPVGAGGDDDGPEGGDVVLGWIAAVPVSDRCVYAGVVEHSVYVTAAARGRGVGRGLLEALIASTEAAGIWTIQSGIFPENLASLALHHRLGFRRVGVRERVGRHSARGGAWRDVVLLERRSPVVG